jgi:hypothetical protein
MNKQKIQEELKNSMLAKSELRTSVLRLLLSAINYYEIQKGTELWQKASSSASVAQTGEGKHYEATEQDILTVIQKEVKQRRDSIEEYKKAQRQELADKEQKELEILQTFLPEQMSEVEVQKIVGEAFSELKPTGMQDMGKVMGALTAKLKGKADMGMVSGLVKEMLSS